MRLRNAALMLPLLVVASFAMVNVNASRSVAANTNAPVTRSIIDSALREWSDQWRLNLVVDQSHACPNKDVALYSSTLKKTVCVDPSESVAVQTFDGVLLLAVPFHDDNPGDVNQVGLFQVRDGVVQYLAYVTGRWTRLTAVGDFIEQTYYNNLGRMDTPYGPVNVRQIRLADSKLSYRDLYSTRTVSSPTPKPADNSASMHAVKAFYAAWVRRDYQTMYGLLGQRMTRTLTYDKFASMAGGKDFSNIVVSLSTATPSPGGVFPPGVSHVAFTLRYQFHDDDGTAVTCQRVGDWAVVDYAGKPLLDGWNAAEIESNGRTGGPCMVYPAIF